MSSVADSATVLLFVKERKLRMCRAKVRRLQLHGIQSDICWRLRVMIKTNTTERGTLELSSCLVLLTVATHLRDSGTVKLFGVTVVTRLRDSGTVKLFGVTDSRDTS